MSFKRLSLLVFVIAIASGLGACTTVVLEKTPLAAIPAPTIPLAPMKPVATLQPTTFGALPGWEIDDLREAWPAFLASCDVLGKKPEWTKACNIARGVNGSDTKAVRNFFEDMFVPNTVFNSDGSDTGTVTGYYEPLLRGSRRRGGPYQTPLYEAPDDLLTIDMSSLYPDLKNMRLRGRLVGKKVIPYFSRAELEQSGALAGKELLWVDDPIDAFFLQVQGSGRVRLADSPDIVRVAYADQNGYPYKSIGHYLVDKGEMTLDQASAQSIKASQRTRTISNVTEPWQAFVYKCAHSFFLILSCKRTVEHSALVLHAFSQCRFVRPIDGFLDHHDSRQGHGGNRCRCGQCLLE